VLFERHYFHRLTDGRFDRLHPGISAPTQGGYVGGTVEYARLEAAMALDEDAALQSASWGIGQVMGANYEDAGFPTVKAMVEAAVESENAQLISVAHFIEKSHLTGALRGQDWTRQRAHAQRIPRADLSRGRTNVPPLWPASRVRCSVAAQAAAAVSEAACAAAIPHDWRRRT
jgi:hypothetical protein